MANNPRFEFDRYVNGTLMAEGVTIERENTFETAMKSAARLASKGPNGEAPVLVYRPAEPVDGLERLDLQSDGWNSSDVYMGVDVNGDYVRFSQAEAIIAAKDKTITLAETTMIEMHQDLNKLEADNAALTARVKELEEISLTHFTNKTKVERELKALETQLVAAKKALQKIASDTYDDSAEKIARAALEIK